MLRPLLLLTSLALFWGCSKKEESVSTKTFAFSGDQIDSVRRENLKTKVDSTIILGFRFGMSKQQYDYNYSRLVANKTLYRFSTDSYALEIKPNSTLPAVDAELVPSFDKNELIQLKFLIWESEKGTGSIIVSQYLSGLYGQRYLSKRSISDIWIKGGLEVEVKREKIQVNPKLGSHPHDIITFRPTQLALLAHL